MLSTRRRRFYAVLSSGLVGLVASVAVGIAPAHAAPTARVLTKGTGSLYTSADFINLSVPAGGAAKSFFYKVINSGSESEQYKIRIVPPAGVTAKLYLGSALLKNTYYTAPVKPGSSLAFKVTVAVAAGSPQTQYYVPFMVRDPETNGLLDQAGAVANVSAPPAGSTSHGLYLKTGSQPYVGGDTSNMILSSNVIKVGNTITFTARLKNNGNQVAGIGLSGSSGFCGTTVTYKQGSLNVTAAVTNGSYFTGPLSPGKYRDIVMSVKLVSPTMCTAEYFTLQATAPDGSTWAHPHVPFFST